MIFISFVTIYLCNPSNNKFVALTARCTCAPPIAFFALTPPPILRDENLSSFDPSFLLGLRSTVSDPFC
jgi:hypothetical protein